MANMLTRISAAVAGAAIAVAWKPSLPKPAEKMKRECEVVDAIRSGNLRGLGDLLKAGLCPNERFKYWTEGSAQTPFEVAIQTGNSKAMELFLESGAKPWHDSVDRGGLSRHRSPLEYAKMFGPAAGEVEFLESRS